jgi:hypothetical protein
MSANNYAGNGEIVPFSSAQEVWFWFMDAQEARSAGARLMAGAGLHPRPCETVDILKIIDRLYRNRRLMMDHFMILRHYGQRKMPPDPYRAKEQRAYTLWHEALDILEEVFIAKGIVKSIFAAPAKDWHIRALVWENKYPIQCIKRG